MIIIIIILIIIIVNNSNSNDYNDGKRKGKALKVYLKTFCWFLKILAVSFSKITEISFNAIISFSPIIIIIVIITIGFLILILFIWLYFQFIIYDSLLSILLCLYLFSFLLYLFLILSSFLFHFSWFISFFAIFFLLYFKWDHCLLHLQVIIFSFILTGLLKIPREERQDRPNHQENSSPIAFAVVL